MKLLLDENLPKRLKLDFINHIVFTVRDMGWNGKKNGELMELLIANKFDALLTFDKNLQFLQNFEKYKLPVIVLSASDNTYFTLKSFSSRINTLTEKNLINGVTIITLNNSNEI
jgi:predicted nuclease of predicted toxin-antitoxin system